MPESRGSVRSAVSFPVPLEALSPTALPAWALHLALYRWDKKLGNTMSNLSLASVLLFTCVQVEEGWWEGVLNGKTGMFPSNFIKELSGESDDLGISQDDQLSKSSKEVLPPHRRGWGTHGCHSSLPSVPWPVLSDCDRSS